MVIPIADARYVTATALMRVEKGGYSHIVLDNALTKGFDNPRDSAFATALFYGVLERLLTLDACIRVFCSTPPEKLTPGVRAALRCGLYQILYMPGVPRFAAVSESVELTRALGQPRAAGLVNGVLQAFIRGGCAIPLPEGPPSLRLSVAYSLPQEICELWLAHYGEERARGMLERWWGEAPLYIRVNTLRTTAPVLGERLAQEGITAAPGPVADCLRLLGAGDLRRTSAFREGLFHVQDVSSQLCALALDVKPGMAVLDVCAAPGGKSFTLAQRMENRGRIVAADLHESRVKLIRSGAQRMGLSCIDPQVRDASAFHSTEESHGMMRGAPQVQTQPAFDRVLCDVPCSGLGVIRRKPEIRYKTLASAAGLPAIQYNILETSSQYIKEGGLLLYSTCTLNPRENEEVVARFLANHRDFVPAALPEVLGNGHTCTLGLEADFDCDGFFMGVLRKNGG